MKGVILRLCLAAGLLAAACSGPSLPLTVPVPPRPAGQDDVLGLTAPPMDTVRIGFVGLGDRGVMAIHRYTFLEGVRVVALCDVLPARTDTCNRILTTAGLPAAVAYSGSEEAYKALCQRDDIDLVYIATDWTDHTPIALYAMEHGKHVAIEVPSAFTMEDIWALVNTAERTRLHCIQLENCCYDFFELTALQMVQKGVFGEVEHLEGAYHHNLGPWKPKITKAWRIDYNADHAGDVYPTHGFGPLCQMLDIHRGDRLETLVSMDCDAANGRLLYEKKHGTPCPDYRNGDQTHTLIRTARGKTVLLQHSVVFPRPYDRGIKIVGTLGYAAKYPVEQLYLYPTQVDSSAWPAGNPGNKAFLLKESDRVTMMERYRSPIVTPELEAQAREVGGHGGMDFIMDTRLVYCLRHGLPLDMDVYDLAEWCCVIPLSELSLAHGSAPVAIPDFTRGRQDKVKGFRYAM